MLWLVDRGSWASMNVVLRDQPSPLLNVVSWTQMFHGHWWMKCHPVTSPMVFTECCDLKTDVPWASMNDVLPTSTALESWPLITLTTLHHLWTSGQGVSAVREAIFSVLVKVVSVISDQEWRSSHKVHAEVAIWSMKIHHTPSTWHLTPCTDHQISLDHGTCTDHQISLDHGTMVKWWCMHGQWSIISLSNIKWSVWSLVYWPCTFATGLKLQSTDHFNDELTIDIVLLTTESLIIVHFIRCQLAKCSQWSVKCSQWSVCSLQWSYSQMPKCINVPMIKWQVVNSFSRSVDLMTTLIFDTEALSMTVGHSAHGHTDHCH
jgi:hypothetical protein